MSGNLLETDYCPMRPAFWLYTMQSGVTGANSGFWVDTRCMKAGSFEFFNDGTGGTISAISADVMVSNAQTIPDNSVDGPIAQTVSALGVVAVPTLARWMKVKVLSATLSGGATFGARLHARS